MELSQAIKGYFLDKEFQFSDETKYAYKLRLGFLLDFCGDVEIGDIDKNQIRQFLIEMKNSRGLSDRSIYDYYTCCSSLWTWAADELGVEHVVKDIPRPTFTKKTIEYFDRDEIVAILGRLDHTSEYTHWSGNVVRNKRDTRYRDRAIVTILLDCGLRVSELCALCIKHYNERRGTLFVAHGKGDKERSVPMGGSAQKALWRYMAERKKPKLSEPLFVSRRGGHLGRSGLGKMLREVGYRAGVQGVHPHKFRHTFAITFLRNGGNVLELQAILGHEDVETLKQYVRLAAVDIEQAQRRHSPADNWQLR